MSDVQDLERMRQFGAFEERERIIKLLLEQNIIRRCAATNLLCAFETSGTEVVYIKNLETEKKNG